ncbi:MAG: nucleotide exchange factor GrpE [Dehalococcoidia bacterium]
MTTEHTDDTPSGMDAPHEEHRMEGSDVATLRAELEETRNKYMRAVADYQNLRRRSEEERREYGRYTLAALVINYLPVLDDLDRALESVHEEIAGHQWVEGVRMVERKFRGVLEASGVREIEAAGVAFDPALHEAISYAPGPAGDVIAVVQPGYTLDGKVVRPAQVVVGNGASSGGPKSDNATTESAD